MIKAVDKPTLLEIKFTRPYHQGKNYRKLIADDRGIIFAREESLIDYPVSSSKPSAHIHKDHTKLHSAGYILHNM